MPEPKENDVVITITSKALSLATGEIFGWEGSRFVDTKANVIAWARRVAPASGGKIYVKDQETGAYREEK